MKKMGKLKKNRPAQGDVVFSSVSWEENKNAGKYSPILPVILLPLLLSGSIAGGLYSFLVTFHISVPFWEPIVFLIPVSFLLSSAYQLPRVGKWVFPCGLLVLGAVCAAGWKILWEQALLLYREVLRFLSQEGFLVLDTQFVLPSNISYWFLLGTGLTFLVLLGGFFLFRVPSVLVQFLITAPFLLLGLIYEQDPFLWTVLPGLACFAGLWAYLLSARKPFRKKKRFRLPALSKGTLCKSAALLCLAVFLCGSGIQLYLTASSYRRPRSLDRYAEAIKDSNYDVLLGIPSVVWNSIFERQNSTTVHGNLSQAKGKTMDNKADLIVTLPMMEENVYLRGYIGSVYRNNRWSELTEEDYMNSDYNIYQWLENSKPSIFDITQQEQDNMVKMMKIKSVRAGNDVAYTPYNCFTSSHLKQKYDTYYYSEYNTNTVLFRLPELTLSLENLYVLPGMRLAEQEKLITSYFDFLGHYYESETYEISPRIQALADQLKRETERQTELSESYVDPVTVIKDYFAENMEYTYACGELPEGKDFVEYFLFENKKGYCVHYASAAALLLRAMGYRIRYVEGYVIQPCDFKKIPGKLQTLETDYYPVPETADKLSQVEPKKLRLEDVYYDIQVTDTMSHAWVEIENGIGWTPAEVTEIFDPPESFYNYDLDTYLENQEAYDEAMTEKNTAKPQQGSVSKEESQASVKEKPSFWIVVLISLSAGIGVLILLILLRRTVIWRLRKKALSQPEIDSKAKILSGYRYFTSVLRRCRFPAYQFACYHPQKLAERFDELSSADYSKQMDLILKSRFSEHALTPEEIHGVFDFIYQFRRQQYKKLTLRQKLLWNFLWII